MSGRSEMHETNNLICSNKMIMGCFALAFLQDDEFFCWHSAGNVCVLATQQCDYLPDCPLGEDEEGCGELMLGHCGLKRECMDGWIDGCMGLH